MPFDGLWERRISPLFWQSERLKCVFSTGTKTRRLSGFSGIDWRTGLGKGARLGLICPQGPDPLFQVSPMKDK